MTITAKVPGRTRPIEVVDYSVTVDATPLAIGDSAGGVGSIDISGVAVKDGALNERTAAVIDVDVSLSDVEEIEGTSFKGRGSVFGHIVSASEPGAQVNYSVEPILSKLNVTKTADPIFGSRSKGTLSRSVTNLSTNPSLEVSTANYAAVTVGGTAAVTRSNLTLPAVAGAYHGRVTWSVAATGAGGVTYTMPVVLQTNYLNWSLRASQAQTVRIEYEWKTALGATISTTYGGVYTLSSTAWTTVDEFAISPSSDATSVVIKAVSYNVVGRVYVNWPVSSYLAFDAMYWGAEKAPYYFDGNTTGAVWTGTSGLSTSRLTISVPVDEGYDATLGYAIRYYLGLCGIPADNVVIDSSIDRVRVSLQGWTGSVWNYFKMLCTAYNIEAVVKGDKVYIQPPSTNFLSLEAGAVLSRSTEMGTKSPTIDIANYNTSYTVNSPVYTSTSDFSVDLGEATTRRVSVEHWLKSVGQPIPVAGTPSDVPASGYYVVTDANNLIVDPSWWTRGGGNVTVTVGDWHDVTIRVAAPLEEAPYTAPFKIAATLASGGPGMVLTGAGVFVDKQIIPLYTGAPDSGDTARLVDNIFVGNLAMAKDRGMHAAQQEGGPTTSVRGKVAYLPDAGGDEFGGIAGTRIYYDGAYYRIRSANLSPGSISIDSADSATTFTDLVAAFSIVFDEFNVTYSGNTFTTFNAIFPTQTFTQFNGTTPTPTFADINAIYATASFNDHSIYPLLTEAPSAATRF